MKKNLCNDREDLMITIKAYKENNGFGGEEFETFELKGTIVEKVDKGWINLEKLTHLKNGEYSTRDVVRETEIITFDSVDGKTYKLEHIKETRFNPKPSKIERDTYEIIEEF